MARAKRDGVFLRGKVWWASRDPISGKSVSTGSKDQKAALTWLNERKRLAASNPSYAAAAKETLAQWFKRSLEFKAQNNSENTVKYNRQKLGHFIRLWGPNMPILNITPTLCDSFVASRRQEGVSDHTICKEFSCLSQVLKLARRAGCFPHQIEALKPLDLKPKLQTVHESPANCGARCAVAELCTKAQDLC